jgi:hypothetical protein
MSHEIQSCKQCFTAKVNFMAGNIFCNGLIWVYLGPSAVLLIAEFRLMRGGGWARGLLRAGFHTAMP